MIRRIALFIIGCLFFSSVQRFIVYGWSNGGYSDDQTHPVYGTHDWVAHHALDWLPQEEKQFILDNLASYLYGTELPDNKTAPNGGIGDGFKHHVYYFANGSLQDDASAVRAREENANASCFFKAGDLVNATKKLGVMSHYICDVASFGHVMGVETDWGKEDDYHHSDYEEHANQSTSSYDADLNRYLHFDGSLDDISAYNATLAVAYDMTFDAGDKFNCTWMNDNYNWSNIDVRNRCGESLNLAVNMITDVLHTFYLETKDSAHFINVPFHYQNVDYYCGPACLEMVFDYYGEDVSQSEIADVARTHPNVTYTDELRRAAHFSNLSTSMGNEMPENITGYSLRKLGYAASENQGMTLTQLKQLIDQDKPLILLMRYRSYSAYGHYRVVVGYNESHVFLHDPWNKDLWGLSYGGPNIPFNNTEFLDLWSYYGNWALFVSPWTIDISAPTYFKRDTPFQINVTIAYPPPFLGAVFKYPASSCNVTVTLPANLSLVSGETSKKTLDAGLLETGANLTVSWMLVANSSATGIIVIEVEGIVSGSVWAHDEYPTYDYIDRIGATTNVTINLAEDNDAPFIGTPSRTPDGDVNPDQEVKVSVNVTDAESEVKNVTILYNLNNGSAWTSISMNYNTSTSLYEATIPRQPAGTWVTFKIVAYDQVGNNAILDGTEPYCTYQVIPEFSRSLMLPVLVIATMFVALCAKRITRKPNRRQVTRTAFWLRQKSTFIGNVNFSQRK